MATRGKRALTHVDKDGIVNNSMCLYSALIFIEESGELNLKNNLVSVIIPVYNVKPFLQEALYSVIRQTYKNLEILIIDDGSTDGSAEICDDYLYDSRITVIHQKNKGLSAARNVGLDIMTGEYVVFLDSDDAFQPTFVEEMLNAIVKEAADIVVCKYTVQTTIGLLGYDDVLETDKKICEERYDRVNGLHAIVDGVIDVSIWNKIYRRELWKDVHFPNGHVYEDTYATLNVFDICRSVSVLDKPLYAHRRRPGSITALHSYDNVRDRLLARSYMVSFVEDRTPEIFTLEQFDKKYESWIAEMISAYVLFSTEKNSKAKQFTKKLRNIIVNAGKRQKCGIDKCGLRTKIGYWIICFCPCFLSILYPPYHALRFFKFYICGRLT